jgi:octaprenyl-diphosphate synthase
MTSTAQKSAATKPDLALTRQITASDMERVNALIIERAQSDIALISQLIHHVVLSGGKRLRPALTLLAARLLGYEGERHVTLATCVEFIHTATLLHDDVVDESHLRRGLATANDLWGNKSSVLVGDFLLSKAFQLMVSDGSLEVLRILSDASAVIAQGEVMQLTTSNELATTEEDYLKVIIGKTATLFAAATELGAVVTHQPQHQESLRQFGMKLGIAFQIMDDALDYVADQSTLGKSVGDDFREGKITLPIIHAFAQGDATEQAFWQRTLGDLDQTESDLDAAFSILKKHSSITFALTRAEQYCSDALAHLKAFPASPTKSALEEIVYFCTHRAY